MSDVITGLPTDPATILMTASAYVDRFFIQPQPGGYFRVTFGEQMPGGPIVWRTSVFVDAKMLTNLSEAVASYVVKPEGETLQ